MSRAFFIMLMLSIPQFGCLDIMMGRMAMTAGEVTKSEVQNLGFLYLPKEDDCTISILSSKKPEKPYEAIGKMKTTIKRNMNIRFKDTPRQDLDDELRKQGCILGGDIVIIGDIVETSSDESVRLQVSSTIVKFK